MCKNGIKEAAYSRKRSLQIVHEFESNLTYVVAEDHFSGSYSCVVCLYTFTSLSSIYEIDL